MRMFHSFNFFKDGQRVAYRVSSTFLAGFTFTILFILSIRSETTVSDITETTKTKQETTKQTQHRNLDHTWETKLLIELPTAVPCPLRKQYKREKVGNAVWVRANRVHNPEATRLSHFKRATCLKKNEKTAYYRQLNIYNSSFSYIGPPIFRPTPASIMGQPKSRPTLVTRSAQIPSYPELTRSAQIPSYPSTPAKQTQNRLQR